MDNSFFINNTIFIKSSHGMHYGICVDIDFDTVLLSDAAYFVYRGNDPNKFSPEYLSTHEDNNFNIVAKLVPKLYVTDTKEIAKVDSSVTNYYANIFIK